VSLEAIGSGGRKLLRFQGKLLAARMRTLKSRREASKGLGGKEKEQL